MFLSELGDVTVISVGDEYRRVVKPSIAWCSRKQDPTIPSRNLDKGLDPCSGSDDTLFVEYKESSLHICVLPNVVPAVYGQLACETNPLMGADSKFDCAVFPVERVPLLGRCDDVEILRRFSREVICERRVRLSGPYATTKDLTAI